VPVTVEEKFGRLLSDRSAELTYLVRGTTVDSEAKSAVRAIAPTLYDAKRRDDVEVEEIGNALWLATARYVEPESAAPETGDAVTSFDTSGGTQHITQSRQTVHRYPSEAPNYQGAIGVTESGVEGVDITVPVYQFSETHYLAASTVNTAYRGTLFTLTGRTNNAAFKGLAEGECLFLGASGSRRGTSSDDDWEISFRFAGSPNVTGLTIGSITGVNKKGWEYLWVRYETIEDTTAKRLVQRPAAVYVEKVYESGNFGSLGIGV
jgi:hypothetical protein